MSKKRQRSPKAGQRTAKRTERARRRDALAAVTAAGTPPATSSAVPTRSATGRRDRSRWPLIAYIGGLAVVALLLAAVLIGGPAGAGRGGDAPGVTVGPLGGVARSGPSASPTHAPSSTPTLDPTPVPTIGAAPSASPAGPSAAPDTPAPTPMPSVAATAAPVAVTPVPTAPPDPEPTAIVLAAADPVDAVAAFYTRVTDGDFDAAYSLWSDRMKASYPRQENLDDRFAATAGITFHELYVAEQSGDTATVQANFTETYDSGSERTFVGYWRLIRVDGRWLLDEPNY